MAVAPRDLSYDTHKYISVILAKSSPYFDNPSSLAQHVPGITHVGQLGVLDVHIFSLPLDPSSGEQLDTAQTLEQLRALPGVVNASVQVPTQRKKRDEEYVKARSAQLISPFLIHRETIPKAVVNQEKIWTVKSLDAK